MSRPALQSGPSTSNCVSRLRRVGPRALSALAWLVLLNLTSFSVTHSVRVYTALMAEQQHGKGGEGMSSPGPPLRQSASAARGAKDLDPSSGGREDRGASLIDAEGESSDYALLYPNGDCVGAPIRILYGASEKNCRHCQDFCSLKFAEKEGPANTVPWTSMFVFGERTVEVVENCLGQYEYKGVTSRTVNVVRPGDGCVNLDGSAAHARFSGR